MRTTLLLLAFLAAVVSAAWGQRASEAGLFVGIANYQGDLARTPVTISETNLAVGVFYQRFLDSQWGVKVSATTGKISGSDRNLNPVILRDRDWSFTAQAWEFAGHLQFHPWGQARFDQVGRLRRSLSPYGSVGLGLVFAKSRIVAPADDLFRVNEPNDRDVFFSIPISGGLRYVASKKLTIYGEFGTRATFSDYLDGISRNGNSNAKDWFMFGGIGVTYNFMAEY